MDLNVLRLYRPDGEYERADFDRLFLFVKNNLPIDSDEKSSHNVCIYTDKALVSDFAKFLSSLLMVLEESTTSVSLSWDLNGQLFSVLSLIVASLPTDYYSRVSYYKTGSYVIDVNGRAMSLSTHHNFKCFEVLNYPIGELSVVRAFSDRCCCMYFSETYRRGLSSVVMLQTSYRVLRNRTALGV